MRCRAYKGLDEDPMEESGTSDVSWAGQQKLRSKGCLHKRKLPRATHLQDPEVRQIKICVRSGWARFCGTKGWFRADIKGHVYCFEVVKEFYRLSCKFVAVARKFRFVCIVWCTCTATIRDTLGIVAEGGSCFD